MIDHEIRRKLSQDLRHLVIGTITNDDFDDNYEDLYVTCSDVAVQEIGRCGWGMYSDSHRYRLRGKYAVDGERKRMAARCVLFLRSGLEYQWPPPPGSFGVYVAHAVSWLGIPAGIALLLCWFPLLAMGIKDVEFMTPFGLLGCVWLVWSIWYLRVGRRKAGESSEWKAWRASGDFDVWPFFRREDFYVARREHHLLGVATASDCET